MSVFDQNFDHALEEEFWSSHLADKSVCIAGIRRDFIYSGNQYWFSVGATEPAKKIAVSVYDETGKLVQTEAYNEGDKAAAGFSPTSSGQYYVLVDLVEGDASSVCLIYSYK